MRQSHGEVIKQDISLSSSTIMAILEGYILIFT